MGRTKPIVSNDYIVGLTDGEGCFYVNKSNMKAYTSGVRVQLHFQRKKHLTKRGIAEITILKKAMNNRVIGLA